MRIWPFQHEERCALQSHVTAPPQVLTRCDHFRKFYDQQFTEKLSYPEHYLRVLKCTKIRSTYTPYTVQRWTPIIIYSAMVGNCSLIPAEYGAFQKNINPLQAASIRGIVTKNSPLISNPSRNKGGILSNCQNPKIFPPAAGFFTVLSSFLNVSAHFEVHFFRLSAAKILHEIRGNS